MNYAMRKLPDDRNDYYELPESRFHNPTLRTVELLAIVSN